MTENELKGLGFELTKKYEHDKYHTNRYAKGILEVEFTYEGDKLLTCDLTISEMNCKPVTLDEMKALTPILGEWHEQAYYLQRLAKISSLSNELINLITAFIGY